ncbi:MAG: hypothetical protein ACSHYA_10180 [Opitutaceae bacterium]
MKKRFVIAGMGVVTTYLVSTIVYTTSRGTSDSKATREEGRTEVISTTSLSAAQANTASLPDPDDPRLQRQIDGSVHYLPAIDASRSLDSELDPILALNTLRDLLEHYRFAYKENPTGVENFEFTEQLLGKNPMRIVFLDTEIEALDDNQLLDTWGTPYFFHPLSATEMEIRSAGPDKQLWTSDDVNVGSPHDDQL